MSDLKEYTLSELVEKIIDNRGKTCPVQDHGFPLIATNCIRNEKLYPDFINVRYVSEETYRTWFRGHPQPDDLIFVLKGTPGRVCWTPDPVNFCIAQDMVALRATQDIVYPKYLFAVLRSTIVQQRIEALHVGSLIPHFKKGDFDKLYVPVVDDKDIQRFIGDTYYDLCYKIELNNQINKNLEALAQALFKQWFVDFEFPNENGQPYKSSGGEMVESEFGMIPKGWKSKALYDFATYINGAAYKDMYFTESSDALPVIKIVELKYGITESTKYSNTNLGDKYLIDTGDILFSWSGSPETSIDTFLWVHGKAWLNQHIFKIVCANPQERAFVYSLLKYWKPVFIEIGKNKQTTGLGHVTVKDLKEQQQPCPPEAILQSFSLTAIPILESIQTNLQEIQNLSDLRNTLLPKLISGQIDVSNALIKEIN